MTLDASGNLGVGTTSPSSYGKLAVNGNIAMVSHTQTLFANKIQIVSSSGDMEMLGASANILFKTGASNDERLRITSGGNVGVNTTSPSRLLSVRSLTNDITPFAGFYALNETQGVELWYGGIQMGGSNSNVILNLASKGAESIIFSTNSSEKMRITSAGEVLMGYTSDQGAYLLQVNGAVFASSYFESSDTRLKNITNTYNGLDFGAIQYTWKDGRDAKLHWGYAAQDVMKYIPDAVNENKDGFLSLDYNQAHTYKIAMLENRIAELEKQLNNK
jgi:hypothetical protein